MEVTDTAVMCFGRFNPPTIGHAQHFKYMIELAQDGSDCYICLSRTSGDEKNPLSSKYRVGYVKDMIDNDDVIVMSADDPFKALSDIASRGYTTIKFVAGGDYFKDVTGLSYLDRLVKHADALGVECQVFLSGARHIGTYEISSSVARKAVIDNNKHEFDRVMINRQSNHSQELVDDTWEVLRRIHAGISEDDAIVEIVESEQK